MTRPSSAVRRLAPLLTACLAAAILLGATGAGAARASSAGMQLHVLWDGVRDAEVDRQLDRAVEAGAGIARVDVGWASLEPDAKGRWNAYHLRRLDAVVDKAEARGLKLLLTLADSPCWASSAPATLKAGCAGRWWERDVERYLPSDPGDFADALAFVARRYGSRVAAWEMWNEPNQEHFSRGPRKAARYAALVKASYAKAKSAAPDVSFLAGALSESDLEFAEALYRAGIRGSFDAFSVHPYSNDVSPLDRRDDRSSRVSFVRGVPAMRDLMLRFGDDKPLWLTEFGWSTTTVRGGDPWDNGVAEQTQARFVREALAHLSSWDYVPVAIYYNLSDLSRDRSSRTDNYGLLRHDGTAKPAYAAFRAGALALGSGVRRPAAPSAASLDVAAGDASTTVSARGRRVVTVVRRKGVLVRASGRAAGARRVRIDVRRVIRAKGRGNARSSRPALRLTAPVSAGGRFAVTFRAGRLARGVYRVSLDSGRGARPWLTLAVR